MNTNFTIHTFVNWRVDIARPIEEIFYSSLIKKIRKSNDKFNEVITYKEEKENGTFFSNTFFPLYEKNIASRENYVLDAKAKRAHILERINSGINYHTLSFFEKGTDKFIGGILYHKDKDIIRVAHRVFDRELNRKYKFETTLDFWAENILVEMVKNDGYTLLSHGNDRYPNINRLGLPLFKLKVGALPFVSKKEHEILHKKADEFDGTPAIFFTDEGENNTLKKAVLIRKTGEEESQLIQELRKIIEWSSLELEEITI